MFHRVFIWHLIGEEDLYLENELFCPIMCQMKALMKSLMKSLMKTRPACHRLSVPVLLESPAQAG